MDTGFHVTHKSHVKSIQEDGLYAKEDGNWRQERKKLRQHVDTYAQENLPDWIPRENAVFFWTTVQDALTFIESTLQYPQQSNEVAILTVNLSDKTVGAANSEFMEEMYSSWVHDEPITEYLTQLQSKTQPWDGQKHDSMELWCKSPILPKNIIQIN